MTPVTVPAQTATYACFAYCLWMAVRLVGSSPQRFTTPSYTILRSFPGGMTLWAAVIAAAGTLIIAGLITTRWVVKAAGLLLLSLWSGSFGAVALYTERVIPVAGPTGGPTYMFVATLVAILIGYHDRPRCSP